MGPKDKDENAKNPAWKTPMDIPGVKPGTYDASMGAPGGTDPEMLKASATAEKTASAKTGPVKASTRKLAMQTGKSG